MKKWTIRKPQMLNGDARYNPNVAITLLIAVVIYLAYLVVSVLGGLVYSVIYLTQQSEFGLDTILQATYEMATSQGILLFSLFFTAALIILTIVYVRFIEKRRLGTMGMVRSKWLQKYVVGFGLGLLLSAITIVPALFIEDVTYHGFTWTVVFFLLAFIMQSASEEVFFRGFMMTAIARKIGIVWAVIISSAVFALFYIFNGGMSILSTLTLFFVGATLALYILRTGSLWAACGLHAAWNFATGLVAKIDIGGLSIDYAVVTLGDDIPTVEESLIGDPGHLVYIVIFLVVIALILFAGKNKLVVRRQAVAEAPQETLAE